MSIELALQAIFGPIAIGLLWKIQRELGGITTVMSLLQKGQDDHEARIRGLESRNAARRVDDRPAA